MNVTRNKLLNYISEQRNLYMHCMLSWLYDSHILVCFFAHFKTKKYEPSDEKTSLILNTNNNLQVRGKMQAFSLMMQLIAAYNINQLLYFLILQFLN